MKILFATPALTIGGIEVLALRLSESFGKAGHQVILYDFNPAWSVGIDLADQYDQRYFRILSLSPPRAINWSTWKIHAVLSKTGLHKEFRQQLTERHFAAVLKKQRPDVICSLSFHQDYIACKYGLSLGIPVVASMHGTYEYAAREWQAKARYIHDHVSAIIYAADKNMSWYKEQPYFNHALPAFKIYTGTDLQAAIPQTISRADLGISETSFVYILVARGIREKGWQQAIDAFRMLHEPYPDTTLLLVGEGTYLTEFKERYADEPGVIFYGAHSNSVVLTALANVGLLPSYFPIETMPNVIVDYLRCSLPVIASDIGEISAMLTLADGAVAGCVLPLQNSGNGVSVPELYDSMLQMVEKREWYNELVIIAKKTVLKFDIQDCIAHYTDVFNQVLGIHNTVALP